MISKGVVSLNGYGYTHNGDEYRHPNNVSDLIDRDDHSKGIGKMPGWKPPKNFQMRGNLSEGLSKDQIYDQLMGHVNGMPSYRVKSINQYNYPSKLEQLKSLDSHSQTDMPLSFTPTVIDKHAQLSYEDKAKLFFSPQISKRDY